MKIEILGAGCMKCRELHKSVMNAVAELDISAEVVKVEDINTIMNYGVMMTPALVIDGVVKLTGKVLDVEEIKKMISES